MVPLVTLTTEYSPAKQMVLMTSGLPLHEGVNVPVGHCGKSGSNNVEHCDDTFRVETPISIRLKKVVKKDFILRKF
jgi:hypothetical protein